VPKKIRVRFAPSPTGFLHLGGARTALFNWAFARANGGTFILRIEDTDAVRSNIESVRAILEGLEWLGLDWDEGPSSGGEYGPYFQSERRAFYRQYAERLVREKKAYPCYCTSEELQERRAEHMAAGKNWRYDRRCLHLTDAEHEHLSRERPFVLRFLIPPGTTSFSDLLRGEVHFGNVELDDFVLVKSTGMPTYNFACVVDDIMMEITHVIRGDDHLSNTPRQVLLYRALGAEVPQFAHIPMILGKDKTRLSKRHGSPSVTYYRDQGYLPEAMFNYLIRLSWASGEEEKEVFTREEIVERFSLDRVTLHAAVFDLDKLNWMNGLYIRETEPQRLGELLLGILKQKEMVQPGNEEAMGEYCVRVCWVMRERMRYLAQLVEEEKYFFEPHVEFDHTVFEKVMREDGARERLEHCREALEKVTDFSALTLEEVVRGVAKELEVKAAKLIHPLRVAVSGKKEGPGLFDLLEVLGKERVISRLERTVQILDSQPEA